MQIILSDFMSLDGVVQAPGGKDEDTNGDFAHGGWSHPYFDAETMGPALDEVMTTTESPFESRPLEPTAWPSSRSAASFEDWEPINTPVSRFARHALLFRAPRSGDLRATDGRQTRLGG